MENSSDSGAGGSAAAMVRMWRHWSWGGVRWRIFRGSKVRWRRKCKAKKEVAVGCFWTFDRYWMRVVEEEVEVWR